MKMPDNINENLLGICGVNCLACTAYLNKKKPCPGCRAPKEEHIRKSCANCLKKDCATERGHTWCFECEEFPCTKMRSLHQTYARQYDANIIQNGKDAQANMSSFLENQREYYTCKSCGGVRDQHKLQCSDCKKSREEE